MSRTVSTIGKQSKVPRTSSKVLGAYTTDVQSSAQSLKSSGDVRLSTEKMATSNIEAEYIKNLQQQVYFLELEANYLREQARKATDMHPKMSAEAERMLNKLRAMQTEVNALNLEMQRKEDAISQVNLERNKLFDKLSEGEASFGRERRLLTEELVAARKEKATLERELTQKQAACEQYALELEKSTASVRGAEQRVQLLRSQMDQREESHKQTQLALEEKRAELLSAQSQLRELEDKYYSSPATLHDSQLNDLRDELRFLRQKLKETELSAEQDRFLRSKISDDSSHLIKENALLNQQIQELQKQLDRERSLRESWDSKRAASITQLVTSQGREKELEFELKQTQDELKHERERVQHYLTQLTKQETAAGGLETNAAELRARVVSVEQRAESVEAENVALRRDKMLLVDHTAELQAKLNRKDEELQRAQASERALQAEVSQLASVKQLQASFQSTKWEEFERLADSMKSLSRSMASGANV